ncbi:unnamed protein product [Adineta steineri]|uniref:Uncharacterized protein n=1 Tax=Adineta steineri TaxID=433720 RepID=A0A814NHZ8_9BILA|nr:unnamed protein product [Adineta steineri]CAF1091684.1 unnamed protein product [Adineta steineri]
MIIHLNRSRSKRSFICLILFIIILLILNGRPKFIFQSHFHIPWLTDVQLVQSLKCTSHDWPDVLQSNNDDYAKQDSRLTIVIVTAQPEFKRLPLTLAALACHLDSHRIFEVIFLTPLKDVHILEPFLSDRQTNHWPWPLSIIPDDHLLKHINTDSYRLQMIFKLVVSQIIKTEYYMLLDSDCVAIWPIHVEQLLWQSNVNKSLPLYKALYQIEDRSDRIKWWLESEQLLKIKPNTCVSNDPLSPTIGVTPIILSRTIALRTLCRLQILYGHRRFLNKLANWALWRVIFDRMWTEYTLYYLTAQCTKTFDTYHFHRSSNLNFYGLSVWWRTDWTSFTRYQLIDLINIGLERRKKEINITNNLLMNTHSLFTVLQGRQYINPNLYHQLFYPLFIKYLQQQHNTLGLVKILNKMCEQLITK